MAGLGFAFAVDWFCPRPERSAGTSHHGALVGRGIILAVIIGLRSMTPSTALSWTTSGPAVSFRSLSEQCRLSAGFGKASRPIF
jgi:hypothetical protein